MVLSSDSMHRAYIARWISDGDKARASSGDFKIEHDPRVTRFGSLLRRYSVDELPQLWNVIRGQMSLVGPRPPLSYELEHYHAWQLYRLNVPPGITGLWQVSGRNRLSFDEMIALDLDYIENWSFLRDLSILLRTFNVIFAGNGH